MTDEEREQAEEKEQLQKGINSLIQNYDHTIEVEGEDEEEPEDEVEENEEEEEESSEAESEPSDESAEAEEEDGEEEEEEGEPDPRDKTIADLQKQIEALSKAVNDKSGSEEAEEEDEEGEAEEEEPTVDISPSLELTEEEIEEAQIDSGKMKELLQKVVSQTTEAVLQGIPSVVSQTVTRQTTVAQTLQNFFKEHPKLDGDAKEFTKYNIRQVEGEHPEWGHKKILSEAAERTYKGMGISIEARKTEQNRRREEQEEESEGNEASTFVKKPGGKRPTRSPKSDERSELQKGIDSMIASVK